MRRLIAFAVATAVLAGSSAADEPAAHPWKGFYLGAGLGAVAITQTQEIVDALGPLFSETYGTTGHFATIAAGYDLPVLQRYVAGLFVEYDRLRATGDMWTMLLPFENGHSWSIGGRLGYVATPTTLFYGTAGYTQASLDYVLVGARTLRGFFVGGGAETGIGGNWSVRWEYRFTQYRSETLIDFCGCAGLEAETSSHTGRVLLLYRFGGPAAP